ncbi:MAG: ThiF family adenylyltransferase [Chitinophagaceae bacterium]|nr:ThiF family adenylyltransferase [Chitinophagaceae bacterium]
MQYQLRLSGKHHDQLLQHLFPTDGKEAVAVILCGRHETEDLSIMLSYKVVLIPYKDCERHPEYIKWKTDRIIPLLEEVEKKNLAILKIHSHPGGYSKFSAVDDASDSELFPSVFSWSETKSVHGSAVMLPDGKIFGRVFTKEMEVIPFDSVSVAGDDIRIWRQKDQTNIEGFALRTIQAFGESTYQQLRGLKVGVIGCSGTGSPTIEQLARLGVKQLVLIDPDPVEEKNLNRIINSYRADIGTKKTTILERAIKAMDLGTHVKVYENNLYDSKEAIYDLITCDIVVGCVDSVDGRHLVSQITNFYLVPYFDIGVRLVADRKGGIESIVASVNYIQPGCSSLLSRNLYDIEMLREEATMRTNPEEYKDLLKRKYFRGVNVDRPAVISINMQISSMAVNELLNRIHRFKEDPPSRYARMMMDYCGSCIDNASESDFEQDTNSDKWAGRGDCIPFLRMPDLAL